MLSKNRIKLINSLSHKKYRHKHALFIAEGPKLIAEAIDSEYSIESIYGLDEKAPLNFSEDAYVHIEAPELRKISQLETPNELFALIRMQEVRSEKIPDFMLVLDAIRDPGNLGTIIRLADWYGLKEIYLTLDCVDPFNPKVVQASMGSIFRIDCVKTSAEEIPDSHQIYAADMNGESVYGFRKPPRMALVIGNEANGIRQQWQSRIHERIHIPSRGKAESLNAAVATGILLDRLLAQDPFR